MDQAAKTHRWTVAGVWIAVGAVLITARTALMANGFQALGALSAICGALMIGLALTYALRLPQPVKLIGAYSGAPSSHAKPRQVARLGKGKHRKLSLVFRPKEAIPLTCLDVRFLEKQTPREWLKDMYARLPGVPGRVAERDFLDPGIARLLGSDLETGGGLSGEFIRAKDERIRNGHRWKPTGMGVIARQNEDCILCLECDVLQAIERWRVSIEFETPTGTIGPVRCSVRSTP